MLKVTRRIEYALIALKYVVRRRELTSAREISERFQLPFDTTSKVMQAMNSAGILSSSQGIKGGYGLQKPLDTISFLELCQVLEGHSYLVNCEIEGKGCELACSCNIVSPMKELTKKVQGFLQNLSLAEILQEEAKLSLLKDVAL